MDKMKIYYNSKKIIKSNVVFGFFTRKGGLSKGNFSSLNCSKNSGDNKKNVSHNINLAIKKLNLEKKILKTVKQVHSSKIVLINKNNLNKKFEADGIITQDHNISIAVLTADCCPIFLYDIDNSFISCLHVGWKGAYKNIIKKAVERIIKIQPNIKKIQSIIGPCLHKINFEVDKNFKKKFILKNSKYSKFFENYSKEEKHLFDFQSLIKFQLLESNLRNIEDINIDTYSNKRLFFSHRRSTHFKDFSTGRMINIIGFKP